MSDLGPVHIAQFIYKEREKAIRYYDSVCGSLHEMAQKRCCQKWVSTKRRFLKTLTFDNENVRIGFFCLHCRAKLGQCEQLAWMHEKQIMTKRSNWNGARKFKIQQM